MSLLEVAVMVLAIEGYGYLTQNTARTQRNKTTQSSGEPSAASGRNQNVRILNRRKQSQQRLSALSVLSVASCLTKNAR